MELLVRRLLTHAEYYCREELDEYAVRHLSEALPLLRTLVDDHHFQPLMLADALHSDFICSWNLNHESDALSDLAEHIAVMEKLAKAVPENYRQYIESKRKLLNLLWGIGEGNQSDYPDVMLPLTNTVAA